MNVTTKDFDNFEKQFIELIGEFQTLSTSETLLREALRNESARAEAAEAARDAAERTSVEARADALASSVAVTQATKELATLNDELTTLRMQLEFADRQRNNFEKKITEMVTKTTSLEKELQHLRPLQSAHTTLHRQYVDLQERIHAATEEARSEVSRLENELRRVERCAGVGSELRERARLAAAAHARERRHAAVELQHTVRELQAAKAEISRQATRIAELECSLFKSQEDMGKKIVDTDLEALIEVKAALEAERLGIERLEKALAAALVDNATLAAQLHAIDNNQSKEPSPDYNTSSNIYAIDSFLAQ